MLDELKKLTSLRVLIYLLIIAVLINIFEVASKYLQEFSDILLIFILAWILSFVLDPVVELISKIARVPKAVSTLFVFFIIVIIAVFSVVLVIPTVVFQFHSLAVILPEFVKSSPPLVQKAVDSSIKSLNSVTDYTYLIPPVANFIFNLVTVLILSFYLIIEKESINREILHLTPKSWHKNINFVQRVIDQTFSSFLRVQLIWGIIGGVTTWVVMTIFGVGYASSTSVLAGLLIAIPMIGPVIGIIPPAVIALVSNPSSALLVIAVLLIVQQIIFNLLGTKIISHEFKINPVIVMISLLIGLKIAGAIGGIFAVPIASIALIIGREFHNYFLENKGLQLDK